MTEYKVGDTVTPKDEYTAHTVYTIKALGDLREDGDQPAWVTCTDHPVFGIVVNLKFMQPYFEPGYFRLKSNKTADARYKTSDPGAYYERVNIVEYKEDEDV